MRLPDQRQQGFALPLALTASALLLLSSLSLQTLALHARQRSSQALATAQTRDAELSVAMAFQQHAAGAYACLLALPSSAVCSPFTWLGLRLSPRLIVRCR